jgi:hypothetical protein
MPKPLAKLVLLFTPTRRWAQFSLKSLLVAVTLCCTWLGIQASRSTGIRFADVAKARGIELRPSPKPLHSMSLSGGCALADFDDDGWLDVLLVDRPHPWLYGNTGRGAFRDLTTSSGLASLTGTWTGCAVGDYDGDGLLDLVLTGRECLALLHSTSNGSFDDVTIQAGLDPKNHSRLGSSAGWMDLDSDGWLDLVILNYVVFGANSQIAEEAFGELWRNDWHGGFHLVGPSQCFQDTNGAALSLAFSDVDDDGKTDFFIGNDGAKADFMCNKGQMSFKNVGIEIGVSVGHNFMPMAALGADWADFDRNGQLDLTVTDPSHNEFALFRHDVFKMSNGGRSHSFQELGMSKGILGATAGQTGIGAKWLDMDNDGWPDLCYTNVDLSSNASARQPISLSHNRLGQQFVDLAPSLSDNVRRPIVGRGSAAGDFNNDGRIDLLIVDDQGPPMLLMNRTRNDNHWITLDLRGRAPNVFAYGAKVTARAGRHVWVSEVSPASSYLSSSDPRIHWGLGTIDCLDTVTIRWPSGAIDDLHDVAVDRVLRVVEGD